MKRGKAGLIFLCSAFMGIIWRYAWANYFTIAAFHRPFPLLESIFALGMGSFLVFISMGRGWRVIWILCVQVLGFALILSRMIYVFHDWSVPFLNPGWLWEFAGTTRGLLEWFALFFILVWTLIFWFGGWLLIRRPRTYVNICTRFDIGLAFLLALFLLKYVIWFKGGIETPDPLSGAMLLPFFLFSILAIALSRNDSDIQRNYLPGYRGTGVILGFALVVLLFGTALVSLFLPYLTMAARAGYWAMKTAAQPLGPVLVGILRFLFSPRKMRVEPQPPPGRNSSDLGPSMDTGQVGPFGEIVFILISVLVGLISLAFILVLLWLLIRWLLPRFKWLFSRTSHTRHDDWDLLSILTMGLTTLYRLYLRIRDLLARRQKGALHLYAGLLGWGRRSGMPRFSSETPLEYGARLKRRFPALEREMESIIDLFNLEAYGGLKAHARDLDMGRRSWRRMRSPVHWINRVRVWFLQPES